MIRIGTTIRSIRVVLFISSIYLNNQTSAIAVDSGMRIVLQIKFIKYHEEMPLKSYTLIHRDAKLSKNQTQELNAWISTIQVKYQKEIAKENEATKTAE